MSEKISNESPKFLPNPHIKRKPISRKCEGCNKVFTNPLPEGMIPMDVCISYIDPEAIQRKGCFLQSNKNVEKEKKTKINPLKASRRSRR